MAGAYDDAALDGLFVGNGFMRLLFENMMRIKAVIEDAEGKVSSNSMNDLRYMRDLSEEAEDILDEFIWRSNCSSCLVNRLIHDIEIRHQANVLNKKIEQISQKAAAYQISMLRVFDGVQNTRSRVTSSFLGSSELYGRDKDIADLEDMLLDHINTSGGEEKEGRNVDVISILGMDGIGKTALAQRVYNDPKIVNHFEARVWISVSDNFDANRVIKDIIRGLTNGATNLADGLETLARHLHELVVERKFLLVLDDVWTGGHEWEPVLSCLTSAAKGSRILVTTNNEKVARRMGTTNPYRLHGLSSEACWRLFSRLAFDGRSREECENLEEIGRQIVEKFGGLPLAAKVAGGLLSLKRTREEWLSFLYTETYVGDNGLCSVLQLSYNNLPTMAKQCLRHFAIFPKDHSIERDTLIKLWMAQGYLGSESNQEREKIGFQILQELRMRSFFQDVDEVDSDGSMTCKVHGIVHDLLLSLSDGECFKMNVDRVNVSKIGSDIESRKVRHSTLVIAAQSSSPISICKLRKLRTLLILSDYAFISTECLNHLFKHLGLLRVLYLSCCSIEKIPSQIGRLHRLRYLNLSYNRNLKELPEAVCDLCHLQTLNLNGCDNLEKLPQGIGKLTKLRHFEILWTISLRYLPKGVEKLSSLLTLNRFFISRNSGNKACNLGDLQNLEKLQGYLYIDGLGDVADVDEARKASLNRKRGLFALDIWFSGAGTSEVTSGEVLEALQPTSSLEYLGIHYYEGSALPSWMTSLTKLTELILFDCRNCDLLRCLATLGELPFLESLEIRDMENVKTLSFESVGSVNRAFPSLKRLCIHNMRQWEDWDVTTGSDNDVAPILPCLVHLTIGGCPKLRELPLHRHVAPLQELSISECPILKKYYQERGEEWDMISHIPNIKIDGQDVQKDVRHLSGSASSSSRAYRSFTRVQSRVI